MAENKIPNSKLGPKGITADGSKEDKSQSELVLDALKEFLEESRTNAKEWQDKAQKSWDMIHGRVDWSHKTADQSKVHINRVGLALEQTKAQIKQGLVNFDAWLVVEPEPGFDPEDTIFSPENARRLVMRGVRRTNPKSKLTDNIGIAAVENVLATKLTPIVIEKNGPGKKSQELHIEHIPLSVRNYYPDARMGGLYEFYEVEMDHHKVLSMSSDKPTPAQPFIKKIVEKLELSGKTRIEETNEDRDRGNDRTITKVDRRKTHVLHEFWGTVLDTSGKVMKWKKEDGSEIELRNVVITMANESKIISEPKPYPCWDGCSDIISMQLQRSNVNMYGRSLLAPGVDMNKAEDELINAGIDAALKEGYNVNILKLHGMAKKEQASGGIRYGQTLLQNNQLAPGEKLMETVSTGQVPQGLLAILGIVKAAGSENMRLNEVALSGTLPTKQVRATELVAADQTIQGLFESMVADIEDIYIEQYGKKVFNIMLQNAKLLSDADLDYIFYSNPEKIRAFKELSAKEIFDRYSHSFRFRGKGIRSMAQNSRVAQSIANTFSLAAANPIVLDALERQGLDLMKMLEKVLRAQGIDVEEFIDQQTAEFAQQRQLVREEALAQQELQGGQTAQQPGAQNPASGGPPSETEPGSGAGT